MMSVVPVVVGALGLIPKKLLDTAWQSEKNGKVSYPWDSLLSIVESTWVLMLTVERPVESSKIPSRKSLPLPLKQQERQHHTRGMVSY